MFTPKVGTPSSRITPGGSGIRSSASNRRSSSMFTPRRRTSGVNTRSQGGLNASLQTSMIIDKTSQHTVESFGQPLPVLITEALTMADRSTEVSVRLDPSGWAWLVGGRKLFVWRFKQSQHSRTTQCKELTLPPSDLAHNADRVCVIPGSTETQSVACMAVSPEGIVRYWPSVAHETSSTEISAELKGEECACVINFQPYGCVLATTTSSIVLVTPSPGQSGLACRSLKQPQGMFAGFSRRMSSFIFGSGPAQTVGAPLHSVLAGENDDEGRPFYVLSGSHVQKWEVSEGDIDKLVYEADVERLLREALAKKCWDQPSAQLTQLKVWLLDMQLTRYGVMVLGAAVNTEVSQAFYYGIGIVHTTGLLQPTDLDSFYLLDYAERYQEEKEEELLSYRLLLSEPLSCVVFIHNKNQVLIVTHSSPNTSSEPVDKVEFKSPDGNLLGAGVCDRLALFFSSNHGLVSISSTHKGAEPSIIEEPISDTLLRADVPTLNASAAQVQRLSLSTDKSDRLRAAFTLSCSGSTEHAQTVLDELFPSPLPTSEPIRELDDLVIKLSKALVDDYPASDPRWAEAAGQDSSSSSSSLIILQQLRGKRKAYSYYVDFLKKFHLWDNLSTINVRDGTMLTQMLLCEHVEKVEAAAILRELHTQHQSLIDVAIRRVLVNREDAELVPGLTPQDLFYREVSRVDDVLVALVEYEEEAIMTDLVAKEQVNLVIAVNSIIEGMLHEAVEHRLRHKDLYQSAASIKGRQPEYCPWTAAPGPKGLRSLLHKQFCLSLDTAIPEAKDPSTRGLIFRQAVALADFILNGFTEQLDSIRLQSSDDQRERLDQTLRKYEHARQTLIQPFMECEEFEQAASLAEKYFDFPTLIRICETTNAQERLNRYINQFSNRGFSEVLFNWYLKEGKRGKLLSMPAANHSDLSEFLKSGNNRYLSWVHDLGANNFSSAHNTLLQLGLDEKDSLAKRKTLLSLSKLSALASDPDDSNNNNIELINEEHHLLTHQEDLPLELIESLGMDADNMRVLSPLELIQLYVGDDNIGGTEYDFKKALDLTTYIAESDSDVNIDQVRLHVWCKAILRDNWSEISTNNPLESNRQTIFFKTVELAFYDGVDLSTFLPNIEELLKSEDLGGLSDNKSFQFLIRAGYEQIQKVIG